MIQGDVTGLCSHDSPGLRALALRMELCAIFMLLRAMFQGCVPTC